MISSYIEGRVRIRADGLKNPEKLAMLESIVKQQNGVRKTVANPLTGSLLVEYDPKLVTGEMLAQAFELLRAELTRPVLPGRSARAKPRAKRSALEMVALGGAAAVTVASLGIGAAGRRVHAAAGVLFLLFAFKHTVDRRVPLRKTLGL